MAFMDMSGEQEASARVNPGYEPAAAVRNLSNASAPSSGHVPGDYGNPREGDGGHSADARPVLPTFWGSAQESPHRGSGDASNDVWRELNSDSPSLLRLQCLWAYFNLPALSLADSVPGVASVAAQTDGFHSVVQVSSPLLHTLAVDLRGAGEAFEKAVCLRDQQMIPSLLLVKNVPAVRIERIVDLRTFTALRMLFRSELRHSRTVQPEYLLDAAMEAFGGEYGQDDGDSVLDFGQGPVEVTGSTAIPIVSEGTQEGGTPSSLPEGEQLDDDEDNKSPQLASATLHMMGSPVDHHSCPHDMHQQHFKETGYTISAAPSDVNEPADVGTILEHEDDSFATEVSQNFVENREFHRQSSTDNVQEGCISSNCTQSESDFGQGTGLPSVVINGESASREYEQQSAEEDNATAERNNEASQMPSNAATSGGEDELGEPVADQFGDPHHHQAADIASTGNGESCPVETSRVVTTEYDSTIEKQLKHWIAAKGEAQSYDETINVFERNYPSHEFEYWAIDVSLQHFLTLYSAVNHDAYRTF
ncbi:hypothetical protein, conserved [Eimeria brunetti]|uniref:Uncharacterized protein n=1 Tax=Eimeria brunetti TaxID=51314 RepID=U6LLT2_9EIME|nr:hypothetical protein, conserved [Eimeria brunetti]